MPNELRKLSDWIDGFMQLSENSEPPRIYRKWTAISTIAAALQRRVRLQLGISLRFYPNFYIVLVGPSATGKGTSMAYAEDIIKQVPNITLSAQATSLQSLIRRMKEVNHSDLDSTTGEQMFHSSMTIFSDEFTVFLGYNNRELISALCNWYDCPEKWEYDTIKRDRETVHGCWVNLLAGTTPDTLQSSLPMEAIGGGLTSRIIFVVADKKDKIIIFPDISDEELQIQQALVQDLEQITMMTGIFNLTSNAMEFYSQWVSAQEANPPFVDKKFDGYCGRRRRHIMSLSMVCSASRSDDLVVNRKDIERAAEFLEEVERSMGGVFRGMGQSDISTSIAQTLSFFETIKEDSIPLWQYARQFEGDLDRIMMDRILSTLEASKYLTIVRRPGKDPIIRFLNRGKDIV